MKGKGPSLPSTLPFTPYPLPCPAVPITNDQGQRTKDNGPNTLAALFSQISLPTLLTAGFRKWLQWRVLIQGFNPRNMRTFVKYALALVVVYVLLLGGLLAAMYQPPAVFGRVMSKVPELAFLVFPFKQMWFVARKGRLNTGDPAPDFSLPTADRKARVQLSAFRGQRPVVLVFGSHT